jgi:large subunit ribosomal protein L5
MNIKEKYKTEVVPGLQEKIGYKNVMAIPKIEKVVINTGFGRLITSKTGEDYRKTLDGISKDLSSIAGQHVTLTKAKHSIAGFKLREGTPVGAKATLRGKRMYDFLDRLINVVLPRSRDFRGIEFSTVDSQGNLALGIKEHIFFPEISQEKVKDIFGLQVTVATSAHTHEEGLELFRLLGVPFKKEEE